MRKVYINYLFTVIYQVILMVTPLIMTPYVSRVLKPEGVGTDAYILSIVQLFLIFSLLSIPLYGSKQIATKDSVEETSKEFKSIYILQICSSISIFLIYLLFLRTINNNHIYFLIHIFTFIAYALDVSWYFNGKEQIKKVVLRNIAIRIVSIILVFVLVNNPGDLYKYILINSLTLFFGQLVMWIPLLKEIKYVKVNFIDIKHHIKPILILFIPQIIVQMYVLVNTIILGRVTSEVEVGYYNQAYKIIKLGLGVFTSLGTVLLPRVSSEFSKGNINNVKNYAKSTLNFILLSTIPIMIGLMAIANNFVGWFLGVGYEKVGTLIILMSPVIPFVGLATVFGIQLLVSTNQQNKYTVSVLIATICSVSINFVLVPFIGSKGTAIALVIAESVGVFIQIYFVRKLIDIKHFFKNMSKYLLLGSIMLIAIIAQSEFIKVSPILLTLIQITTGLLTYFLLLVLVKDPIILKIKKIVLKN